MRISYSTNKWYMANHYYQYRIWLNEFLCVQISFLLFRISSDMNRTKIDPYMNIIFRI